MIKINMSDVISIIHSCKNYLIVLGVIAVFAFLTMIVSFRMKKSLRKLVRSQAAIGLVLTIVIVVNLVCFGPMSNLISLASGGSGTITDEATQTSLKDGKEIAREGIVLLENDGVLPLTKGSKLNVFGWSSVYPVYGGSGAGALNDLYDRVTLLEGLESAGFTYNNDLVDLYTEAGMSRSEYGADWNLPELPAIAYSEELLSSAQEFSNTAMVVISRTGGEGKDLPTDMSVVNYTNNSSEYNDFEAGESYLQLSQTEEDLLNLVCNKFEHVILVYNGLTTMELGFVEDYSQIEGVLWCAGPGQNGFEALGEILNGSINPSGKTSDTFVYDLEAAPWWNNFGNFAYDNMSEFAVDESDPYMGGAVPTFVNYNEGIYVGYRYYETAAAEGILKYDNAVQYPFGYGLSYTSFEQNISNISEQENGTVQFNVTVTNTGDVAGKDVIEVYYNPPYTNGGIEKSTANLIYFDKTGELQPGESQTVSVSINKEDMASYDAKINRCYVLEAGDYIISINKDSHNVIDSFVCTVVDEIIYGEENARSTDQVAAVNQFEDAVGEVTYLSRADQFANLEDAIAAPASLSMSDEMKALFVNTSNYVAQINEDDVMPITGAQNGAVLSDLRGKAYDDEAWESLLDQLTIDEMNDMIAHGGFQTAAAASVGKISTTDCDGPSAVSNNFTGAGSVGFPSPTMIACTWNQSLAKVYGEDMGTMADELGASGWYAPSANLHRTAFGGRNYEYFSEDSLLSGKMAANAIIGAAEKGVYAYMKHYALNEQETNRWAMICTWVNEQTIRELYLKPFEICVKEGNATAVMSAFNYIGGVWAGGHKALLTNVLREEWGFEGFVDTDYFAGAYFMNADQMIQAGGDTCLSTFDVGTNYVSDTTSATNVNLMRTACHNIMYTVVNSNAYSSGDVVVGMENWKKIAIAIDVFLGAIFIGLEFHAIRKYMSRNDIMVEDIYRR